MDNNQDSLGNRLEQVERKVRIQGLQFDKKFGKQFLFKVFWQSPHERG